MSIGCALAACVLWAGVAHVVTPHRTSGFSGGAGRSEGPRKWLSSRPPRGCPAPAGQRQSSFAEPGMAHYEEVRVSGYGDFCKAVEQHQGKTIFAYFTGDKDAEGRSWCPDCVEAEPVVLKALEHIPEDAVFIYCQVGDRPYWKDPNNDFKKQLNLTAVPTLLKYGTPQKLVESECMKVSLVEMLFADD